MALILLTSACGSPGVTTTTLGLSLRWSRPAIAIEADPGGGSSMMAGFFQGFRECPPSIVDLLMAHRSGDIESQLSRSLIAINKDTSILPGPRTHAQARNALELWEPVASVWSTWADHVDVFIDAGRLGMESYPVNLLPRVDLVLLLTHCDLPSLASAKQWADLAHDQALRNPGVPRWATLLINEGNPYTEKEVTRVLRLDHVGSLRHDPSGARHYSHGSPQKRKTGFDADLDRCAGRIQEMLREHTAHHYQEIAS
ncbi:MAG: hypothetical protein FWG15_07115 [Propionibacteriaceae bacterium]|nr:hypothetical protein [Propionibacteriaceae bacterium]